MKLLTDFAHIRFRFLVLNFFDHYANNLMQSSYVLAYSYLFEMRFLLLGHVIFV